MISYLALVGIHFVVVLLGGTEGVHEVVKAVKEVKVLKEVMVPKEVMVVEMVVGKVVVTVADMLEGIVGN